MYNAVSNGLPADDLILEVLARRAVLVSAAIGGSEWKQMMSNRIQYKRAVELTMPTTCWRMWESGSVVRGPNRSLESKTVHGLRRQCHD